MTLRNLIDVNHECDELFISEGNTSFLKPVFHYHLTSGKIPEELLDREIRHFQSCSMEKYGRRASGLNVTLKLEK